MFYDDTIAGSWTALAGRLDACSTATRWAASEPVLGGLDELEKIAAAAGRTGDPTRSDAVLGALVRLAATDDDALLVALHCLSGVVNTLARDLKDLHHDIVEMVVGELTCQIRTYLRHGRSRAFAENLRMETRRALLAELRPGVRHHPEWGERLTDHDHLARLTDSRPDVRAEDLDLLDLLLWSVRAGVDADGIRLLWATEQARSEVGVWQRDAQSVDRRVASEHGLCERTLYRRRERTLTALRSVAGDYLAAVA
ncbi:hypothetical protein [uncultured Jatrophihabitans sp.]|uniref:hypothetical protein n=1 Tax=uncultured Jatrophihabitans sp. TaxID=1610747 RepID=UPI0035C94A7D